MPYSTPEKLQRYLTENKEIIKERLRTDSYKHRDRRNKYKEKNLEMVRQINRNWRIANREAHRAHKAVQHAIKYGKLIRPDHCTRCGVICKPHAHHHNGYIGEHRLDVVWICSLCHGLTRRSKS